MEMKIEKRLGNKNDRADGTVFIFLADFFHGKSKKIQGRIKIC